MVASIGGRWPLVWRWLRGLTCGDRLLLAMAGAYRLPPSSAPDGRCLAGGWCSKPPSASGG